ncbi:hypothetical protein ACROYT_G038204 [Oculina patagonica]
MRVCKNEKLYPISQQEVLRIDRILKGGVDSDIDSEDEASDASDDEQPGGPSRVPCRTRTGRTTTRIRFNTTGTFLLRLEGQPAIHYKATAYMCYTMIKQVKPINSPTDPSKEKVESKKSSFYTKWKVFASDTTLHGLRYVVQSGISIPRRATWLIFLCVTGSAYLYYSTTSFEKFMSRPIKTIISQETPIKGLKFPAVTICNLNKFMKSKIDMADVDENFEKLGLNISGCSETRAVRGNLTCGQALLCAFHPFGYGLVDNCNASMRKKIVNVLNHTSERLFNEEQFLAKFGHDLAGMFFLYCRFSEEEEVCSEKEFVPTLTRKGICYTFNSGDNNSSLFYSEMEGPELGLSILLNVQTNESTLSEYSTGLQVIVHDQKTFVNRNIGFNILPGTHASVAVKLREHKRLQAPFETNCSSQNEIPGVGNYTKDACVYQCYANMTSDICGCHYAGFPGDISFLQIEAVKYRFEGECSRKSSIAREGLKIIFSLLLPVGSFYNDDDNDDDDDDDDDNDDDDDDDDEYYYYYYDDDDDNDDDDFQSFEIS